MNTSIEPHPCVTNPSIDPVAFWKLDQKSRYPEDAWGWDDLAVLPELPRPRIVGNHSYDLLVNHRARRPTTSTMRKLTAAFPEDFAAASDLFEAVQWRVLYYVDLFPMAALGNPSFDPLQAFQEIYDREPSYIDVPQPWTGSPKPAINVLCDIRAVVSDAHPDVAKAAYAILGFSRSIGLEKHEVLIVPFWRMWWIDRFLAAST